MADNLERVRIIDLPSNYDNRGILTSIEASYDIPLDILRIFYMHHITADRGGHAHIDTDQVVIPIYGSFKVTIFDGENTLTYTLDEATKGLYIPRLLFTDLYDFSPGAVCLVLANTHYDINKSLRNKQDYMKYINSNPS